MGTSASLGPPAIDAGRYRLLVETVTECAIYMLDPAGIVASWNPGAQRLKGYEAHEILGRHFSTFYTPEDREADLPARALAAALREQRFQNEGWRLRKDGTRFWANVVVEPILSADGGLVGFAKVTRDISERRQAEEALRRSEEQFRRLVQGVTDYAIYMLDAEGRVSNWNAGAERIKGYTPQEVIGEPYARFFTPEDAAKGEPARALQEAATRGRCESEGWRLRKDGSRFWADTVLEAIRDESGALLGFAKITRDITEKRKAERALVEAREALFQSQKMDALGQLTGGIAHDFNNLLMAVLGSLELVRRRLPDDPRIVSLIDNAVQGAQRGAALTQRMLSFARRQALEPEAVEIPALVAGMTGLLQRSLGPSVRVETRFPAGLPRVQADAHQLELALINLAVNARDAMPHGGAVLITARSEPFLGARPPPGEAAGHVCLSLTDSGEGMDAETLARATEPFFTTKGIGKGTGLGLSMVHGMAEQSGGRLMLHSHPGVGTTAELWLPTARDAPPPSVEAPVATTARAEPLRRLRVLAVDDDGLVLMNTTAMLEELGHEVLEAASAREALAILDQEPDLDLVITDQAMPHMTGLQLAAQIRERLPGLPVIIATGYAELPQHDGPKLPRLSKPFNEAELGRVIAQALPPSAR